MFRSKITNIVAKVVCNPVNPESILAITPQASYNPKRFPAIFLKQTSGSCNIFPKSGTVVFLGYKSLELLNAGVNEFLGTFHDVITLVSLTDVCSVTATVFPAANVTLDLDDLCAKLQQEKDLFRTVVYEPDLHNTLQIHFAEPQSLVIMLHRTGKGIVAGAKNETEIQRVESMLNRLAMP